MITHLETAYNKVAENYQKEKLQLPVMPKDILVLTKKAALVPSSVEIFIRQVLEEAERLSKP